MTDLDILDLAELYSRQFGVPKADASTVIGEWRSIFERKALTKSRIEEAIMAMLEEGPPLRKDHRLAAILKRCVPMSRMTDKSIHHDCRRCNSTGAYTVPHEKDYLAGFKWRGEYTMMVRCLCPNGDKFGPCMTIDFYDSRFPHWRDEYPIRHLEWKMLRLTTIIDREGDKLHPDLKEHYNRSLNYVRSSYDTLIAPPAAEAEPRSVLPMKEAPSEIVHDITNLWQEVPEDGHNSYHDTEVGSSFPEDAGD